MPLRKQRTSEDIRKRKGIDSFIKSLGTEALEYGKGRLRDYPKEAASGWKNILGITKRVVPENLEGVAPVGEAVGGMSVSINQALKQLGRSAVKLSRTPDVLRRGKPTFKTYGPKTKDVRRMAANIRRSPEEALESLSEVGYV